MVIYVHSSWHYWYQCFCPFQKHGRCLMNTCVTSLELNFLLSQYGWYIWRKKRSNNSCFIGINLCDRPNTMKKLFVNKCLKMDHLQMFSHVCAWEKIAFFLPRHFFTRVKRILDPLRFKGKENLPHEFTVVVKSDFLHVWFLSK